MATILVMMNIKILNGKIMKSSLKTQPKHEIVMTEAIRGSIFKLITYNHLKVGVSLNWVFQAKKMTAMIIKPQKYMIIQLTNS